MKKQKSPKAGHNKARCERYRLRGMWLRNKLKRVKRHLRRNPNDEENKLNLERLSRCEPSVVRGKTDGVHTR
jgi:ribosomal protein S15P/S13E